MAARTDDRIAAAFEHAPALLARLRAGGPLGSIDETMTVARAALAAMGEAERVAVLGAHPRIGAEPASLSAASRLEQGGGDDPAVLAELARLNAEYERRNGFRFVAFVNGRPKRALLPDLRARLARPREAELATGLEELLAIARDRLERSR